MIIELLNKRELEIFNKHLKYPLAIAEKDYFLALVSKIIYNSALREKLVFKGGTALHHVYLEQLRFSEDLDFTAIKKLVTVDEINKIFTPYDFLEIKKGYTSKATVKLERLKFNGPLGQPNSLKIDIDFIQNVVLPPVDMKYKNNYGVKTKVRVMDIREICAEKIRTISDRARYRDFYDLTMIFRNFKINFEEIIGLINQKEIRRPITKKSILRNWEIVKQDKQNKLSNIYYSEEISDNEIQQIIKEIRLKINEK
ncbi:nucleotidyl transferase AbiEii/AbiGii toxin family protein [Candidatus Parcubacteria bacterium]|nr:nucleotidyl transferase AbiEii/AbiGii toxin family protein [Candidatus Parcubacteria bacterium]